MSRDRSLLASVALFGALCTSLFVACEGERAADPDGPHARGAAALVEGRAARAFELLDAAFVDERSNGSVVSSRLLRDHALAAWHSGALSAAEASARDLIGRGDVDAVADGWLLVGAVDLARADLAHAQATGPEAEPFAFDAAIALARSARAAFERAVLARELWPAAVRNAERARRRELVWSAERDGREPPDARTLANGTPDVQLVPTGESGDGAADGGTTEQPARDARLTALTQDELEALLGRLADDERERLDARAARREERSQNVEKDW